MVVILISKKITAMVACKQSNLIINDHFSQVGKMIDIAKSARRTIIDYKLSRYACYLIVQMMIQRRK